MNQKDNNQNLSRNITLLPYLNFFISLKLFGPIVMIYFAQITNSYALAISIFSIVQISQALLEVPAGIFSDKYGRRNCIIIGTIASFLGVTFYAIGHSYIFLVIGAIMTGTWRAFFSGNNDALLYETLDSMGEKKKYNEVLGKANSMPETAMLISGLVGGFIAAWSFPVLMWLSVIPQIICVIISFRFVEVVAIKDENGNIYSHLKEAIQLFKTNIQLRRLSIANILEFGIGESSYRLITLFYNSLFPVWAVSLLSSFNSLLGVVTYRLSGKIIGKFKAINLVLFGELSKRAVNIFAFAFPTIFSPILMSLFSIMSGPAEVAKNSLIQEDFSNKHRSTMASINALFGSLCFVIVSIPIGILADNIGVAKTMLIAQFLLLPVIWIYWRIFKDKINFR